MEQYVKWALGLATRFSPRHLRDEAESVAIFSLNEALSTWEEGKGYTLFTHIKTHVRGSILKMLRSERRRLRREAVVALRTEAIDQEDKLDLVDQVEHVLKFVSSFDETILLTYFESECYDTAITRMRELGFPCARSTFWKHKHEAINRIRELVHG